jgi:hypothetical protein
VAAAVVSYQNQQRAGESPLLAVLHCFGLVFGGILSELLDCFAVSLFATTNLAGQFPGRPALGKRISIEINSR